MSHHQWWLRLNQRRRTHGYAFRLWSPSGCLLLFAFFRLSYFLMQTGIGACSRSKNAAKNAKKKAKAAAAKKAAAEQAAVGASDAREERVEKLQEPGDAPTPAPAPAPAPVDPAKEAKKIQKKLRQIEQLEEKQAGGATLEEPQLAKLATKSELEAQLAALGV